MFDEPIDFTLALVLGGISSVVSLAFGALVYLRVESDWRAENDKRAAGAREDSPAPAKSRRSRPKH